ncbi:hypothetical protein K440DRAFT_665257, partial [Wilcoxina mikolae CBS 423.85]
MSKNSSSTPMLNALLTTTTITATMPLTNLRPPSLLTEIYTPDPRLPLSDPPGHIALCHPGYPHIPEIRRVLVQLPSYDLASSGWYRIHYGTALTACSIITGYRDGMLRTKLMSQSKFVDYLQEVGDSEVGDPEEVMTEKVYYSYPLNWSNEGSELRRLSDVSTLGV